MLRFLDCVTKCDLVGRTAYDIVRILAVRCTDKRVKNTTQYKQRVQEQLGLSADEISHEQFLQHLVDKKLLMKSTADSSKPVYEISFFLSCRAGAALARELPYKYNGSATAAGIRVGQFSNRMHIVSLPLDDIIIVKLLRVAQGLKDKHAAKTIEHKLLVTTKFECALF